MNIATRPHASACMSIYAPTPTIICFTLLTRFHKNRETHSCQSFTGVKQHIILQSDALHIIKQLVKVRLNNTAAKRYAA